MFPWVLAFHIMAVICWMVSLFYLPRLLVYHMPHPSEDPRSVMLSLMERRLLKMIATPSMIVVFVTGFFLVFSAYEVFAQPWFGVKFLLVMFLTGIHGWSSLLVGRFARGERPYGVLFYRLFNEIPPLLTLGIILLVILKPW